MDENMILFVRISIVRMIDNYLPKLAAAISKLDQETLWKHEVQWMNSIGGIVLHIDEHLNRHVTRYSRSGAVSGGIEDYFPDLEHTGYHLGQIIDRTQRLTHTSFQFVQNGMNEKSLKGHLRRTTI